MFIRNCRTLDMSLEEIRLLLRLWDAPESDCGGVNDLIDRHIEHVVKRIEALKMLEAQLRSLRESCANQQDTAHCGILQGLATSALEPAAQDHNHLGGLHKE